MTRWQIICISKIYYSHPSTSAGSTLMGLTICGLIIKGKCMKTIFSFLWLPTFPNTVCSTAHRAKHSYIHAHHLLHQPTRSLLRSIVYISYCLYTACSYFPYSSLKILQDICWRQPYTYNCAHSKENEI